MRINPITEKNKVHFKRSRKNQCPICLKDKQLIRHHWYEDKTYMVGYIRLICRCCNMMLRTMNDDSNHILPEWDKQVEYVNKYRLSIRLLSILSIILKRARAIQPRGITKNCPRCHSQAIYHQIRREQYYCRDCLYIWPDDKEINKITNILSENSNQTIDKKLGNRLKLIQMAKLANAEKPRCPKCNSAWTYHRIYREEWYCRTCQYTWPYITIESKEAQVAPTNTDKKD